MKSKLGVVETATRIYSLNDLKKSLAKTSEQRSILAVIIDPHSSLCYLISGVFVDVSYDAMNKFGLNQRLAQLLLPKSRAIASLQKISSLLGGIIKFSPNSVLKVLPLDVFCKDLKSITDQANVIVHVTPGLLRCIAQTNVIAQDVFVKPIADSARETWMSTVNHGLNTVVNGSADSQSSWGSDLWTRTKGGAQALAGAAGYFGTNAAEYTAKKIASNQFAQLNSAVTHKENEYVNGVSEAVSAVVMKSVLTTLLSTGLQCWLIPNVIDGMVSSYIGEEWTSIVGTTARVCMWSFTLFSYHQRMVEYRDNQARRQNQVQPLENVEQEITNAIVNTANQWAPSGVGDDTLSTFIRRCKDELPKAYHAKK